MRSHPNVALLLLLFLASPVPGQAASPHVIVLKDGRSIRAQSWQAKDAVIELVNEKGEKVVIRKDLVDLDKSRLATEAARRTPTPTPTPREKGLVELSREMQERRKQGENPPLESVTKIKVNRTTPVPTPDEQPVASAPVGPTPFPAETPAGTAPTPAAAASAAPATPRPLPTPAPPPPASPLLLYGGIGLGVAVLAGAGAFFAMRKKPAPSARRAPAPSAGAAPTPASSEDLLMPAFADESPADDLPAPAELADEFSAPAELGGSSTSTRSLPEAPPEVVNPGILADGEVQIRISGDVYTCPNLSALKRWVEEGRVIENSEILAPDGSWLMAGTIPDLESAFARRRDTLGY